MTRARFGGYRVPTSKFEVASSRTGGTRVGRKPAARFTAEEKPRIVPAGPKGEASVTAELGIAGNAVGRSA